MPSSSKYSRPSGLFVAIVIIAALYFARVVFVPLALALLFAVLLTPIVSFFERIRVPRIIAIFLIVVTVLGLAGLAGWKASQQFVDLTQQLPSYKKPLEDKIHSLPGLRSPTLNKASDTVQELAKEVAAATPGSSLATDTKKTSSPPGSSPAKPMAVEVVPPTNALEYVENMLGPLLTALVIAVFTIFILMGREDLRDRFLRLAGGRHLTTMTQALDDATRRINRYLLLLLTVNVVYGLVVGIALHFIGIPNAALWGLSATVLRFLPYVGPPLAALMPTLLALAAFSGWGHAFSTMGLFFGLELVVSNILEPLLYGAHVGLSPLAILISAIFWTLIWGLPGLVLATPLTVCLVVMGRYVPDLNFLSILLGDEPVLSPDAQYYQRLLSADQTEARHVLEQYLKEKPIQDLYAKVIIPALSLAEQDRHRNALDQETQDFIYQSTRDIIEELDGHPAVSPAEKTERASDHADILCIPARDEADSVVAMLLCRLLALQGQAASSIAIKPISEMLSQASDAHPAIVCISALPPFALGRAETLYTKLRAQIPNLRIMVCVWDFDGDMQAALTRLNLAKDDRFFTTVPQVLDHIASQSPKDALVGS